MYYIATNKKSHLSETLDGISIIRAFSVQSRFLREFRSYMDINSRAYYYFLASVRWLGYYVMIIN